MGDTTVVLTAARAREQPPPTRMTTGRAVWTALGDRLAACAAQEEGVSPQQLVDDAAEIVCGKMPGEMPKNPFMRKRGAALYFARTGTSLGAGEQAAEVPRLQNAAESMEQLAATLGVKTRSAVPEGPGGTPPATDEVYWLQLSKHSARECDRGVTPARP